ncbi:MAG: hypothetical protein R3B06_08055 [Kofleriaceae bacterium]
MQSVCTGCQRPVLELSGQFENLDSYYIEHGVPRSDTAGCWHTTCLTQSPYGSVWSDARIRNFTTVRGYAIEATTSEWTVLAEGRTESLVAFSRHGEFLDLCVGNKPHAPVPGGARYDRIVPQYNLHLTDRRIIAEIQTSLESKGRHPLPALFSALDIVDRVAHPEVMTEACLLLDEELREEWTPEFVCASITHGIYIPDEIRMYVGES